MSMATVVLCDSGKERLIMPVAGATFHSFNMPSIGKILHAVPKALVGFLAAFSGISNARSIVSPFAEQHGGGLQTGAHARWQSNWQPQIQICLSEPWVHHFDPDRSIIECTARQIGRWRQESGDPYATEVVSRSVARHQLPSSGSVPDAPRSTSGSMKQFVREVSAIMRENDEYERTMEQAEELFWFHSSTSRLDLGDSTQHYTAARLIELLDETLGVESFMEEACPLSFRLHKMAMNVGKLTDSLKPELIRFPTERTAFQQSVNKNFVAPDASMDKRQFRTLLSLLAQHINERNSRPAA